MNLSTNTFQLVFQYYGGMLETSMSSSRSQSEIQAWKEVGGGQDSKSQAAGGAGDRVKVC